MITQESVFVCKIGTKAALLFLLVLAIGCSKDEVAAPVPAPVVATISNISPTNGPNATVVTITGNNFGTDPGKVSVIFGNVVAVVQAVTNTTITATVPENATTGAIKVVVNGNTVLGPVFTVNSLPVLATIANISPNNGPKATLVTINGDNFGADLDKVSVFFNNVEAAVQTVTNTAITTTVPVKAGTGEVRVIVNGTELIGPVFTYIIDVQVGTLAGSTQGSADGTGTGAQFSFPAGIAMDGQGTLYVADSQNHKIRKITPSGEVSTLAGSTLGFADGSGTSAQFDNPTGVAVDAQGTVYVADSGNNRIRKITPNGEVSSMAGSSQGFADGTGTNAQFYSPTGVSVDAQGTVYVADSGNNRIRKITPSGEVSTLAGSSQGFADGTGTGAQFYSPYGVAVDAQGTVYVADSGNHRIRKITPSGEVSTLAGSSQGFADGTGTGAQFLNPYGVSVDALGTVYVADTFNHKIRKITPNGEVSTLAGSDQGSADGAGTGAQFSFPAGIAMDGQGTLYVADTFNNKIRIITQE